MESFTTHTGVAAVLDRVNVDTDQIIPKQFLKRIERTGFGQFLFFDWRFQEDGKSPRSDFELNRPAYAGATILVTGANFGCGSSREHAPWALRDYGFRSIVAPSFADIFYNNCFKNGILPIALESAEVARIMDAVRRRPGSQLTVDLVSREISGEGVGSWNFEVDPFRRECLLNGWDDIGLTLRHEAKIRAYESKRASGK